MSKVYTNASNTNRAAKAELSKTLGLDKKEIVRGTHYLVNPVEGGFVWEAIEQAPATDSVTDDGFAEFRVVNKSGDLQPGVHSMTVESVNVNDKGVVMTIKPVEPQATETNEGLKIEKDREERNGIKRPSRGGKCATLWSLFDEMLAESGMVPTPKPAKERSAEMGLDPTTTQVQLYRWREFMGFKK